MGAAGARQLMRLLPFIANLWGVVRRASPGDGRALEDDVRDLMVRRSIRSDHVPGGYTLLGVGSASGLWHQIDLEAQLDDAILIGELKAYRGSLPKNDLLCFAAASDDLFLGATRRVGRVPIFRVLAGTFSSSERERRYAAIHGILLVEPGVVPAPLLADASMPMPQDFVPIPDCERAAIASLARPMQEIHGDSRRVQVRAWELLPHRLGVRSQVAWSERILGVRAEAVTNSEVVAA